MHTKDRVKIHSKQLLSNDWFQLHKITFDFQRRDGSWQRQSREAYDRGNGVTMLLVNPNTGKVILTRQFRMPVFINGHDGMLIEAAAGLLDNIAPDQRIRAEVEEETGYRITRLRKVFEAYMSPGSVTEKLYFYLGEYDESMRINQGGGVESEGEDLEVLEMPLTEALQMIHDGDIVDGKTIMLLQYVALHGLRQEAQ